jgi:uncharacterized protein YgiB involved in biofilm formation
MKRSATISLFLMGSAVMTLAGCKPKAESYKTEDACVIAGEHTAQECHDAFDAAKREHETTAPHYASREECAASYGWDGCEERHAEGGSGFFMPMMMGYMLGGGFGYHPLYQDRNNQNGYVSSGGARFGGFSSGGLGGARSGGLGGGGMGGGGETGTVSRGGFGGTGEGMSAGG